MGFTLEAYIQTHSKLLKYYKDPQNCSEDNCEDALNYIINNQDKIKFDMWGFGNYNPSFEILNNLDLRYDDNVNLKLKGFLEEGYNILRVSLNIEILNNCNNQMITEINELLDEDPHSGLTINDLYFTTSINIFEKRINDLVIATNLWRPGSLRLTKGAIVQNQKYVIGTIPLQSSFLKQAIQFCNRISYPKFEELDLIEVWNWLNQFKSYSYGFSNSSIERGLSCFTLLFEKDEPERLFYSIMGLEALYVIGNSGIQEQVKSKSEVLLGKQVDFKKMYSNMYGFRSRFIHGDMNFPVKHCYSIDDKFLKFNKDMQESTNFSTGLLIASLQKLCLLNKTNLDFEIKIAE